MPIIVSKMDYENPDPGLGGGELHAVKDLGIQDYGNGPEPMLELEFATDQMNSKGTDSLKVRTLCTKKLGRKTKLLAIATALLDGQPVPNDLDVESLIGKRCQLLISLKTDKNGGTWGHVDNVLPPAKTTPRSPSRAGVNKRSSQPAPISSEKTNGVEFVDADVEFPGDVAGA